MVAGSVGWTLSPLFLWSRGLSTHGGLGFLLGRRTHGTVAGFPRVHAPSNKVDVRDVCMAQPQMPLLPNSLGHVDQSVFEGRMTVTT